MRGDAVVTARRPLVRLPPDGIDKALSPQAGEERVDGALTGHEPVCGGQFTHELEAVAFLVLHQRQDAVLDRPSAHLGKRRWPLVSYHAIHSTWQSHERIGALAQPMLADDTEHDRDRGLQAAVRSQLIRRT